MIAREDAAKVAKLMNMLAWAERWVATLGGEKPYTDGSKVEWDHVAVDFENCDANHGNRRGWQWEPADDAVEGIICGRFVMTREIAYSMAIAARDHIAHELRWLGVDTALVARETVRSDGVIVEDDRL